MINFQQQSRNTFSHFTHRKQKLNKISLKTKRTLHLDQQTRKRILSFQSNNHLCTKDSVSGFDKVNNQIPAIDGMFRYLMPSRNCCEVINTQTKELFYGVRKHQTNEIKNQIAVTLRSSASTQDKYKRRVETESISRASNYAKTDQVVYTQNRIDSFGFTDIGFIIEDSNFPNIELTTSRQRKKTDYQHFFQDIQSCHSFNHNKISLKRIKQNNNGNLTSRIEKIGTYQRSQIAFGKTSISECEKSSAGCVCLPQCFWMDKWSKLAKINYTQSSCIDQKTLVQIEKDIQRTQPYSAYFNQPQSQNNLKEVLLKYSLVSPHIGYVQGMNFIASVIVYHSKNVAQSCALFNFLMKQKQYETIYQGDLSLSLSLAHKLTLQLKQYQPQAYQHVVNNGVDMQIYIRNWYFTMLGNIVPLESMHLVIDKFIKKGFEGINQLLLSLLIYLKEQIMNSDPQEIIVIFSVYWLSKRCQKIDWLQIMGFSQNIALNAFYL